MKDGDVELSENDDATDVGCCVGELEKKLDQERNSHLQDVVAREEKFSVMLAERDAEVDHLQAELDEAQNMSIDQSTRTSRIFETTGDDWMDEKSREEVTQYYEESMDQIIMEFQGDSEDCQLKEAAEEAELSLRNMAQEAGYGDLNKASLAIFGIRALREDNEYLRARHDEDENATNQLMHEIQELKNQADALGTKIRQTDTLNATLQRNINESRTTIDSLRSQTKELQSNLGDKTKALDTAMAEIKRLGSIDDQFKKQTDLITVRRSYNQASAEVDKWKVTAAQTEKMAKENHQNFVQLRNQTEKSSDELQSLRVQLDAYMQRNSQLLRTVETADKVRKDQVMALEQRIEDLQATKESLIRERDAARATALHAEERYGEVSRTISELEHRIKASEAVISKLKDEKAALEKATGEAAADAKQARSRYNVLHHESTEKERIWSTVKAEMQNEIETKSRVLHHSVEPYEKALARIAAEVEKTAPEHGDGAEAAFEQLAAQLVEEEIASAGVVAGILVNIKSLDSEINRVDQQRGELEKKNQRLKAAIKKWGAEHTREKGRVEQLTKKNQELDLHCDR